MVYNGKPLGNISAIPERKQPQIQQGNKAQDNSFEKILKQKTQGIESLKFSKHAEVRMYSRNINLSEAQLQKMNDAVNKAGQKGVRDSLILIDDLAFVVNVRSRTVITAVNSEELKENVFTNIDGAVVV